MDVILWGKDQPLREQLTCYGWGTEAWRKAAASQRPRVRLGRPCSLCLSGDGPWLAKHHSSGGQS